MFQRLLLGCVLLLAPAASEARATAEAVARGFDLAYNLDYDAAVETFEEAIAADPHNPGAHRGLAAVTWMRILFLRGTMTVDDYLGSVTPRNVEMPDPPADLAAAFKTHSARAIELAEAMVDRASDDPEAHYQLGASVGLAASYMATVDGKTMAALKPAKDAYAAHARVLELDPTRTDAMLVVGTYRYLVSTLPLPIRLMARMAGFGGGKEEGLRLVREAARHAGETRTEAQYGLVLLYNREREYDAAQGVLRELKRRHPRNRVIWLEAAATALRDERPALAAASLREGFAMLDADDRVRMLGEDALWLYTRGATHVLLERESRARTDLLAALDLEPRLWVSGRTHLELGKLADLAGDRERARQHYDRARALCDDGGDKRGVALAKRFKKNPYRSP